MKADNHFRVILVRKVARAFLEQHYKSEMASFDLVWDIFRRMVERRKGHVPDISKLLGDVQTGLGFSRPADVDAVGLIVLGTVARVVDRSWPRTLLRSRLSPEVSKAAAACGARGELLAALMRHLPDLVWAARSASLDVGEAVVSAIAETQYEIWTGGENRIVTSIEQYERRKGECLIWIDRDEKRHLSPKDQGKVLGKEAIALLLCLTEKLGSRVPTAEILRKVWDEEKGDHARWRSQTNKIQQQLASLEKFSGNHFREHLFPTDFESGVGLMRSFKDKYFMFTRL